MEREVLELAHDSPFIERVERTFTVEDTRLLRRAQSFLRRRSSARHSLSSRATALLQKQDADAVTIASAMLAPLLWHGLADPEEIREHFGFEVATVLKNLQTSDASDIDELSHRQEDLQGIFSSMGKAPRSAVLIVSFRLLALEDLSERQDERVRRMARETLRVHVPLADRLSLGEIRRRLEDTCFRILDPKEYERLKREVAPIQADDDRCLQIIVAGVRRLLDNNGITGRLQGRTKSLYGIRRKMNRTGRTLGDIMDRIGLRVLVDSVPECYAVLGLLHTHFKPIPGTFDDYIGLPKDNGYQSLHTCVYPVREISHKPIEFQIRTDLMHKEAEHGAAAHWRYKNSMEYEREVRNQVQWAGGLSRRYHEMGSDEAFIDLLHRQVFANHLVVFGKGGRIVRLDEKATVQDFLTTSNIEVSPDILVKVNGKIAALDRPLQDGDSVEVIDGGNPPADEVFEEGPSRYAFLSPAPFPFDQLSGRPKESVQLDGGHQLQEDQ
jgi:GTP pyrophosphokinase